MFEKYMGYDVMLMVDYLIGCMAGTAHTIVYKK